MAKLLGIACADFELGFIAGRHTRAPFTVHNLTEVEKELIVLGLHIHVSHMQEAVATQAIHSGHHAGGAPGGVRFDQPNLSGAATLGALFKKDIELN